MSIEHISAKLAAEPPCECSDRRVATAVLPVAVRTLAQLAAAPTAGAHFAKQRKVAAGAAAGGCRLCC
jgi:hypothetical protein